MQRATWPRAAREALAGHAGDVLVLYADTPLLPTETIAKLRVRLDEGAGIAVLGFEAADPDRLRTADHATARAG